MSGSISKVYLAAGASWGLGLALVADILSKDPSAIVYAGARDSSSASQLIDLASNHPGRVEIVNYVAGDKEGNEKLAKEIGHKHGWIDTVIANAGSSNSFGKIHETPIHNFEDPSTYASCLPFPSPSDPYMSQQVNCLGPIVLFQAVRNLLQKSLLPRFVPISSVVGSLEMVWRSIDVAPYGMSKAALNWATRKIHFENEWLGKETIYRDKNGTFAARKVVWHPPTIVASILMDIISASKRKKDGGEFLNVEGTKHPW